jgi:hypothetical protein
MSNSYEFFFFYSLNILLKYFNFIITLFNKFMKIIKIIKDMHAPNNYPSRNISYYDACLPISRFYNFAYPAFMFFLKKTSI